MTGDVNLKTLGIRLPDDVLEQINKIATDKKKKDSEVARDMIVEALRMNALKEDIQETKNEIKKILAYAEWNQSMVGELARLVCDNDREKFSEYGQKVKANYQALCKKSDEK